MQNAKKISRRTPVFFARVRLLYYGYWNFVVGGYTNCHRSLIVTVFNHQFAVKVVFVLLMLSNHARCYAPKTPQGPDCSHE